MALMMCIQKLNYAWNEMVELKTDVIISHQR